MAEPSDEARPEIEKFVSDPKYASHKAWLWSAFDAYVKEREEADKNIRSKKENSFLTGLLGPFAE